MKKTRRLRTRIWLSRLDQRFMYALKRRENGWRGDHRRWWEEGRQAIAAEGIDPSDECPF